MCECTVVDVTVDVERFDVGAGDTLLAPAQVAS